MVIGGRLKAIRELKKLSRGDIVKRTGFFRSYISRVENGHTIPSIDTLDKWSQALEIPIYQLFYRGDDPALLKIPTDKNKPSTKESKLAENLRSLLARMKTKHQDLILHMARKLVRT